MTDHTPTRRPRQPIERTVIDETYTYIFDNGRVDLLRNGKSWIQDAPLSKAWIAAANVIEDLRSENLDLSLRLEAAEHVLGNLDRTWDEEYEDYV